MRNRAGIRRSECRRPDGLIAIKTSTTNLKAAQAAFTVLPRRHPWAGCRAPQSAIGGLRSSI
jgi:hypothetical protein